MSNTSGRFRRLPEYENSQITNRIKEKIHSKRDRTIMYLKLVDNLSFMMIANKLNMPMSTVTSVYYKQIDIVFEGTVPIAVAVWVAALTVAVVTCRLTGT